MTCSWCSFSHSYIFHCNPYGWFVLFSIYPTVLAWHENLGWCIIKKHTYFKYYCPKKPKQTSRTCMQTLRSTILQRRNKKKKKKKHKCKKPQRRVSGSCLFGARVNKLNIMHNSRLFSFNCWKWYTRHIRNALFSFTEQVQTHETSSIPVLIQIPYVESLFWRSLFFKISLCATLCDRKKVTNMNIVLHSFSNTLGRRELTHSLVEFNPQPCNTHP